MSLSHVFAELARHGRIPAAAWPEDEALDRYGLASDGAWIRPLGRFDPLQRSALEQALSGRARGWLRELDILAAIGSTNAELVSRAQQRSIDGSVCLAEVQLAGRGRRGRSWFSPFAANLAVSIGVALQRSPRDLGGISLAVGLAVLDALEQLDVPELALKWPNDVLLGDAKLGGILIEMVQQAAGVELVVGIGLNVALPPPIRAELEQAVADLSALPTPPSRSHLAGLVVSSVVDFVREFETLGFEPFRQAFDARHAHHRQDVVVLRGDTRIAGRVAGVSAQGGLLLQTQGELREFQGGEVSLRRDR